MPIVLVSWSQVQAEVVPAGRRREAEDQTGHELSQVCSLLAGEEPAPVGALLIEQAGVRCAERVMQEGRRAQLSPQAAWRAPHRVLQAGLETLHVGVERGRVPQGEGQRQVAGHLVHQRGEEPATGPLQHPTL